MSMHGLAARFLSRSECESIVGGVLSFAKADETRVTISSGVQGNTRFAVNQISTTGDSYDTSISIRSVFGRRAANTTTNKRDDASLRAAVERAEALARLAPEDPESMPELGPQQYGESAAWSEATVAADTGARARAVRAITGQSIAADVISTGFIEVHAQAFAIGNSKGLFGYRRETASVLTTTVRTPDGTGSGWAGAQHHDFSRIDPEALGRRAIDKALRSRNPTPIEPGRYTVVFEPTAVANLVQLMAGGFNARSAEEGRSFFSKPGGGTKVGMKIVDERVTIITDPADSEAPGPAFNNDGIPLGRQVWIENGVLKTLSYDRYWAERKGVRPNPSAGGFSMSGGTASLDDLIASTERGILCTRFWYIRGVDQRTILNTGLTRDGTFLIENGKISRPVKNLRWNDSPVYFLNNIDALGKPVRVSATESGGPGAAVVVPPVKAHDFSFTSLSDAV